MQKKLLFSITMLVNLSVFSQTDSTGKIDTIKIGKYVIIKKKYDNISITKKRDNNVNENVVDIQVSHSKNKNISTRYFIFDLGFCNFNDQTNYATAQSSSYFQSTSANGKPNSNSFNLINSKSSNVNIWLFMQKLNIAKHKLNLKYGLGLEMYNYRFENSISYRTKPFNYITNDSVNFSKNKLYLGYVTVPLMLNFKSNPNNSRAFNISAGISASYLIAAHNKQISDERGLQKVYGNFDFRPFKLAAIAELGLGKVQLYGSYSFTSLNKSNTGLEQYPCAFGIRFSRF